MQTDIVEVKRPFHKGAAIPHHQAIGSRNRGFSKAALAQAHPIPPDADRSVFASGDRSSHQAKRMESIGIIRLRNDRGFLSHVVQGYGVSDGLFSDI